MSPIGSDAIAIRRMMISYIDSIIGLVNKTTNVETHGVYQDLIAYDLDGPLDLSLAAEAEGQIVGFVIAHLEYIYVPLVEVCLIHVIIVDPEYKRRHIGSALVSALSSIAIFRALARYAHLSVRVMMSCRISSST